MPQLNVRALTALHLDSGPITSIEFCSVQVTDKKSEGSKEQEQERRKQWSARSRKGLSWVAVAVTDYNFTMGTISSSFVGN